ncbi:hypothetical protein N9Z99_01120 [Akkermansiaceae bacterium]|nr:hypothetical protein [Akkermansiaceae bacterium]
MTPNQITLGFVFGYMAICIAIGLWAWKRTTNTHDFFMASRNLGVVITGIALFSSIMSGFGFVGGAWSSLPDGDEFVLDSRYHPDWLGTCIFFSGEANSNSR